ncbi:hypothetical protein MHU86_24606 [Fragilaria crotonensis]|nr:hypothetical protein MHU86_24606 [Fragilaria crotonensis]
MSTRLQDFHPSFLENLARLETLERWRELAIRPSIDTCHKEDRLLLNDGIDNLPELEKRSLHARDLMNKFLPIFKTPLEESLVMAPSRIPGAGNGLFYQPSVPGGRNRAISAGETICYYYGHIHNFQSARKLNDKSYLMLVSGTLFVDPRPCLHIKARFINDPLNDEHVNCEYLPDPANFRCIVVATKEIQPNSELFVTYGDLYWNQQQSKGSVFKGAG